MKKMSNTFFSEIKKAYKKVLDLLTDNYIWCYINYHNDGAFKVLKQVKKVFVAPKIHFKVCKPHMFGGHIWKDAWLLQLDNAGCFWKDKWDSPRFEGEAYSIFGPSPRISLTLFKSIRFIVWWTAPCDYKDEDTYWEMWLWYKYYCESDIDKARATWPWTDMCDDSTWKEEFVLPKWRNS